MTKLLLAKTVVVNSLSLHPNKNSTQKKDSQMNQVVAQSAVLPEKHKAETVAIHAHNVKCSLQFAPLVAKKPQFLSNLQATNPFIAATATSHVPETTGNHVSRTLLGGLKPGRVFY